MGRFLFLFVIIAGHVGVSCKSPPLSDSSCNIDAQKVNQELEKVNLIYIEEYGYGIALRNFDVAVGSDLITCGICHMTSNLMPDSTLVKLHLALTLVSEGQIELLDYEVISGVEVDSIEYDVNGVKWVRPLKSYNQLNLKTERREIKEFWIYKLSDKNCDN